MGESQSSSALPSSHMLAKASVCRALPWFAQRGIQTDTRTWAKTERGVPPPCPRLCWVFKPVLFWNWPVPWACPGEPGLGEMG